MSQKLEANQETREEPHPAQEAGDGKQEAGLAEPEPAASPEDGAQDGEETFINTGAVLQRPWRGVRAPGAAAGGGAPPAGVAKRAPRCLLRPHAGGRSRRRLAPTRRIPTPCPLPRPAPPLPLHAGYAVWLERQRQWRSEGSSEDAQEESRKRKRTYA
jgi:hypothetical protein